MIRVNNQYLDLLPGTAVEIDKQSKLFEELDTTTGDFSYTFDLPYTANNYQILSFPGPDNASKTIYNDIPAEYLGRDGVPLYTGKLRIERMNSRTITASFFSGNYNWLSVLSGNLTDLDFSEYDTELSVANIQNFSVNTDGLVFPLVDLGGLITRKSTYLKIEDFTGCLYVKTIFRKILNRAGIKFNGDLVNDWLYNNTIICKDSKSQTQIEDSSCFVEKSSTTTRATENVDYKVTFQNDSTSPYFDGDNNAFDLANSRYVAPFKMAVTVECSLQGSLQDANYSNRIRIYINGAYTFVDVGLAVGGLYNTAVPGDQEFFTIKRTITLEQGDILEIYSHWQESTGSVTPVNILTGTLRITPVFAYKVFGNSLVPNWTQKDFILSILNLFNVISNFDPISKTVTFNLFEKLASKTPLDISAYVDPSTIEIDFTEFISSFGKKNFLTYQEGEDEDLTAYNIREFVKYGTGVIEVDNDFIDDSRDIIESGFTSPISYINTVFDASLERLNLIELETGESIEFTAVTNNGGAASFTIALNTFRNEDLVRITDSTNPDYNGDWVCHGTGAGAVLMRGLNYNETATGRITRLNVRYRDNDAVFILVHLPFFSVPDMSSKATFALEINGYANFSFAYFNLLNNGTNVNTDYLQGLGFGDVNNMLSYQKSLIDTYWKTVDRVLNDPVKVKAMFRFPESVFRALSPLVPVFLKTKETSNMYYINKIRGYKGSHLPCEVELIKL